MVVMEPWAGGEEEIVNVYKHKNICQLIYYSTGTSLFFLFQKNHFRAIVLVFQQYTWEGYNNGLH